MYIVIRNIYRNNYKSAITISICICLVLLLNVYLGNIDSNKRQLDNLPEVVPVHYMITSLNGHRQAGLVIKGEVIEKLRQSSHIKEGAYTVRMMGGIGEFDIQDWKEHLNLNIIGINNVNTVPGLTSDSIHINHEEQKTFFSSSKMECIISSSLMEKRGWEVGDNIPLNLYYYIYDDIYDDIKGIDSIPLELLTVKIGSEMEPPLTMGEQIPPDILLPLETIKESYERNDVPFSADSASFYVANPLMINEFKEEMKSIGLMAKVPSAMDSYQGIGLTVKDSIFISLASQLQQTISMLYNFFLTICITIIIIGYIASFLLIGSRQKEFSLMRALGVRAWECFRILWLEQFVLILIGGIIGSALCIGFQSIRTVLMADALILISYLLGVSMALWRLGRKNTVQLLFMED